MADIYALASPAPTLYIYPSALHPSDEATGLFGVATRVLPPERHLTPSRADRRRADEEALAVLGVI